MDQTVACRITIVRILWSREYIRCKQGLLSIMVGRKRKQVRREKNGRAQRTYINPKAQVAGQPHRLSVPHHYRERVEAESEFGRLMLNGRISPAQYEAGTRYRGIVIQMRRTYDVPRPEPKAIDWHRLGGKSATEISVERVGVIRAAYQRAFEAATAAGNRALRAVNAHAVFDSRVRDPAVMPLLIAGLDQLVRHYGIDPDLRLRIDPQSSTRSTVIQTERN